MSWRDVIEAALLAGAGAAVIRIMTRPRTRARRPGAPWSVRAADVGLTLLIAVLAFLAGIAHLQGLT